jgi:hypothetical protein
MTGHGGCFRRGWRSPTPSLLAKLAVSRLYDPRQIGCSLPLFMQRGERQLWRIFHTDQYSRLDVTDHSRYKCGIRDALASWCLSPFFSLIPRATARRQGEFEQNPCCLFALIGVLLYTRGGYNRRASHLVIVLRLLLGPRRIIYQLPCLVGVF